MSRGDEQADANEELLRLTLHLAVPLWVDRFIRTRATHSDLLHQAVWAGDVLAEQGDSLMFRTKYKDNPHLSRPRYGTAEVFNQLARGIAAASFSPGGCRVFGLHFESDPKWLRPK
jgi:hypothetical protein